MMKKYYVFAWILLIGSTIASIYNGTGDGLAMITMSLIAGGLVYAFASWVETRDLQPINRRREVSKGGA